MYAIINYYNYVMFRKISNSIANIKGASDWGNISRIPANPYASVTNLRIRSH